VVAPIGMMAVEDNVSSLKEVGNKRLGRESFYMK
jgi:hypothetical protein